MSNTNDIILQVENVSVVYHSSRGNVRAVNLIELDREHLVWIVRLDHVVDVETIDRAAVEVRRIVGAGEGRDKPAPEWADAAPGGGRCPRWRLRYPALARLLR